MEWEKDGSKIDYREAVHKISMTDNLLIRKAIGLDSGRYTCVVLTFDRTRIAESSAELVVTPLKTIEDSKYAIVLRQCDDLN